MSAGFRIPAARAESGALVLPEDAERQAVYACPACDGRVDLHAGDKKRRHFHHRPGTCASETVTHLAAKAFILQATERWLAGAADPPLLDRGCAFEGCARRTRQAMPPKVGRAVAEHRLPSGHVADVALLSRVVDLPVAVVEVRHTHAVDDDKALEIGVPWIEVDAAEVCAAAGRVLVAVRDRLLPWLCPEHTAARGAPAKKARVDRERLRRIAARLGYRLADFPAYRVARLATCPRGHDALVFAWDGASPPDPRPAHVVAAERAPLERSFRPSAGGWTDLLPYRRVFVSVCPTCGEPVA